MCNYAMTINVDVRQRTKQTPALWGKMLMLLKLKVIKVISLPQRAVNEPHSKTIHLACQWAPRRREERSFYFFRSLHFLRHKQKVVEMTSTTLLFRFLSPDHTRRKGAIKWSKRVFSWDDAVSWRFVATTEPSCKIGFGEVHQMRLWC